MSEDVGADNRLQIRQLTVELPNGRSLLDRVSLEVGAGEIAVILGRSGAGKSTLGDVLFDLLPDRVPDAIVEADALASDPDRMALILQRGSLFDHFSVHNNIRFAARRRRGESLSRAKVVELLEEVGLPAEDRGVADLSGGEERRINVARGLATDPKFFFFDEPTAGLDVSNVRRVGTLIRKVCTNRRAGAIVVTHNPLLAALVGDKVLYLDRTNGTIEPLLDEWQGPVSVNEADTLAATQRTVESALLAKRDEQRESADPTPGFWRSMMRAGRGGAEIIFAPGRLLAELFRVLLKVPSALRHPRDFLQLWWRTLHLTGFSGIPFFALVAAIFSATFLSIAFAAAALVSPQMIVENLRGDFILAITPALCGFLFAARSGSALAAWLGGLSLRRQTDALKSLGVSVDQYLRVPALLGTFMAFLFTVAVFSGAMYFAATATATGFGVTDAAEILRETTPDFRRQLIEKTLLYGLAIGVIGTHIGLLAKRNSSDVARGITRTIIFCTLAVVFSELFFAIDLHGF